MKANNKTTCDPCEQDFKRKVSELVKEGKSPSHLEREKREHEVKAAFREQSAAGHPAEKHGMAGHTAHKTQAAPEKPHAMAGGPKMKK